MSPEQLQSFLVLATGYQCVTARPASFRLISRAPRLHALMALPLVIFAAPFIIMRNTLRARRIIGRRFELVMLSTVIAGFWSLMCGTLVVMLLQAVGQLLV